jgi:hypothetical protein
VFEQLGNRLGADPKSVSAVGGGAAGKKSQHGKGALHVSGLIDVGTTAHDCKQASTSTPVLTPQTQAKMLAYDRVVSELNAARLRGTSYPIVHSLIQAALATPNDVSFLFFSIDFSCHLHAMLSWVLVFFITIRTLFDLLTLLSSFSRLFSLMIGFTAAFRSFVAMFLIHSLTNSISPHSPIPTKWPPTSPSSPLSPPSPRRSRHSSTPLRTSSTPRCSSESMPEPIWVVVVVVVHLRRVVLRLVLQPVWAWEHRHREWEDQCLEAITTV